jgi:hypothetical protein
MFDVHGDFVDCLFDSLQNCLSIDSDATFTNCMFISMTGPRGGAIHAQKSTLLFDCCIFINCSPEVNGGAVCIQESIARFEREIAQLCFVSNNAKWNGRSVFAHAADVRVIGTCVTEERELSVQAGKIMLRESARIACRGFSGSHGK